MFTFMRYARWVSCAAAAAMVASPVFAAGPRGSQQEAKVFDVAVSKAGKLVGQLVDASGRPQENALVSVASKAGPVMDVKTDRRGVFALPIAKPGVYEMKIAGRVVQVRAWQKDLAPPAARESLLCVANQDTVRGQCGGCGAAGPCGCGPVACGPGGGGGGFLGGHGVGGSKLGAILTNPLVLGLGVATAIALPIALDDDDDAS